MRAVVLDGEGLPKLTDLPVPSGPGLLVRVVACGLCGSDVEKLGRSTAGTVIGRARLKGDHGPAPQAGSVQGVAPTVSLGQQARTQYILPQDVESDPVAGWLVVVKGPGRGGFHPIFAGMNSVGRDPSQRISLSFGDESISREEHAFITYDEEQRSFYLQHGGKSNLVRLGTDPVLTPVELKPNDLIRIGKTTLRFIPLCGPDFAWSDEVTDT